MSNEPDRLAEEPEYVTRAEAADLAGVDTRTVDRWANEGRITRHKVAGRQWVRFRRDEIAAQTEVAPVRPEIVPNIAVRDGGVVSLVDPFAE